VSDTTLSDHILCQFLRLVSAFQIEDSVAFVRYFGLSSAFESSLARSFVRVWSPFVLSLGQYEIRTFVGTKSGLSYRWVY